MASLTTPTNTTTGGTGAQQQNADEAISEAPAGEDDLGEDESAFDEEGILFGDSELINATLLQLLNMLLPCSLVGQTVNKKLAFIDANLLHSVFEYVILAVSLMSIFMCDNC